MNSDSEQCTKSKLGCVHQVHTLNPACTHRPCALRPGWPCRGSVMSLCPAVSWLVASRVAGLAGRPCRKPSRSCRSLYRDTPSTKAMHAPCRALPRVLLRLCAVSQGVERHIAAPGYTISRHKVAPQPRYKVCIVTRPLARPYARVRCRKPRAAWPYRRPYRALILPCRGLSRPYHGRVPYANCALCYPVSRYKNCIVTQTWKRGSSPSSFVSAAFPFFSHFFSHSCYLKKNHQKKIFSHFLVEPNKFIKIYFIHFFSSFTHCKTSEKKFSSHHLFFFFSSSVASLLLHNCSSLDHCTSYN